jgi:hypothetical protein
VTTVRHSSRWVVSVFIVTKRPGPWRCHCQGAESGSRPAAERPSCCGQHPCSMQAVCGLPAAVWCRHARALFGLVSGWSGSTWCHLCQHVSPCLFVCLQGIFVWVGCHLVQGRCEAGAVQGAGSSVVLVLMRPPPWVLGGCPFAEYNRFIACQHCMPLLSRDVFWRACPTWSTIYHGGQLCLLFQNCCTTAAVGFLAPTSVGWR